MVSKNKEILHFQKTLDDEELKLLPTLDADDNDVVDDELPLSRNSSKKRKFCYEQSSSSTSVWATKIARKKSVNSIVGKQSETIQNDSETDEPLRETKEQLPETRNSSNGPTTVVRGPPVKKKRGRPKKCNTVDEPKSESQNELKIISVVKKQAQSNSDSKVATKRQTNSVRQVKIVLDRCDRLVEQLEKENQFGGVSGLQEPIL